jgi:hypothetical protein
MVDVELVVRVMSDRNATVAHVVSPLIGGVLGSGSAKRMPGEVYNEGVGINLAVARALRDYANVAETVALEDMSS